MMIKTSNDRKPSNDNGSNVMKTPTEGAAMKPATPKTELRPSSQLRQAVFRGSLMRGLVIFVAAALLVSLAACDKSAPPASQQAAAKTDRWSWLPKTTTNELEANSIPGGTEIIFQVPQDEPIVHKGRMEVGRNGILTPEKGSFSISGGALLTKAGPVERKAKFGDWDFVFTDLPRTQQIGWGPCLVSGQVLLPRTYFLDVPQDRFVENSFAIESFGERFVLITLDPSKGHRLCLLNDGDSREPLGMVPTAGFIGSKAEIQGKIIERKVDGWYDGLKKVGD